MKNPQYKIGDYVEFKYNGELKKGWIEQVVKLDSISSDMFVLKTKSGKTYYAADGIIGDLFKIIRKLPILRDKNGRFKANKRVFEIKDTPERKAKVWELYEELLYPGMSKKRKNSCSCFNCDKCAKQMGAYYEKTGELKPSNVTKGPVKNSTGGGKTTETVTEDYMSTLEFGQMPYDSFGSRVKTECACGKVHEDPSQNLKPYDRGDKKYDYKKALEESIKFEEELENKTEEKKPKERIAEIYLDKVKKLRSEGKDSESISTYLDSVVNYLDEQFEKGKK